MKTKNIIALAFTGMVSIAMSSVAQDSKPEAGDILQDINMFNPEEGDPSYKVKANEQYGTQWALDMAYGFWGTSKSPYGSNNKNNLFLYHGQLNQRLIEDEKNGGTWLRVEVSGSVALDKSTRHAETDFVEGMGSMNDVHGDYFGVHNCYLPEIALMQYFANKKACLIVGVVNLTNYFDAVGIANDSFCGYANTGFMNSSILPLVDSNFGGLVQVEFTPNNYAMLAASRTGAEMGYNPFTSGSGKSYCIVGEYGHIFRDGEIIVRLNPFLNRVETEDGHRNNTGLVGSVEYAPCDRASFYVRSGFSSKQDLGTGAEISFGTNVKLISSREDDFFGVSYGIFKPMSNEDEPAEHNREGVLELMYSFQVNDYMKIVPHYQYIHNAAYSDGARDASVFGVQAVFSF